MHKSSTALLPDKNFLANAMKAFETALARADDAAEVRGVLKSGFNFISDEHLDFLEKEGGIDKLRELYYQVIQFDLLHRTKTSHFITAETFLEEAQKHPDSFAAPNAALHTVRHRSSQTSSIEGALDICTDFLENKGLAGDATLFDMGCGTGKILVTAMDQNGPYRDRFRRAVGIDYYKPILDIAQKNLNSPAIKIDAQKISLVFEDAARYNQFNGTNVVVAYNPFDAVIMKEVERNVRKHAGNALFAYIKPLHGDLFKGKNGWRIVKTVDSPDPDHKISVFAHGFN